MTLLQQALEALSVSYPTDRSKLPEHIGVTKALRAAIAQGAVVVPKEPTPAMHYAAGESVYGHPYSSAVEWCKEEKFESAAYTGVEAYRAMIAAAQKEQGAVVQQWRPISEAPKDGKRVLLRGYGTTQVAGFGRVMGCDFDAWVIANDVHIPVEFAEVWQPLPPAPKEQA